MSESLVSGVPRRTMDLSFHSRKGSQYVPSEPRVRLQHHGCLQSMKRRGNCCDSLPMERVWHLKVGADARQTFQGARRSQTRPFFVPRTSHAGIRRWTGCHRASFRGNLTRGFARTTSRKHTYRRASVASPSNPTFSGGWQLRHLVTQRDVDRVIALQNARNPRLARALSVKPTGAIYVVFPNRTSDKSHNRAHAAQSLSANCRARRTLH